MGLLPFHKQVIQIEHLLAPKNQSFDYFHFPVEIIITNNWNTIIQKEDFSFIFFVLKNEKYRYLDIFLACLYRPNAKTPLEMHIKAADATK